MEEKIQIAYAEVMQVLKYFDREYVMKIPIELLEYFKEHQKKDVIVNIDKDDIFNKKNISREALALLAYIDLEYWCKDEEEKNTVKKVYIENERKYQKDLSEKYDNNNIFENRKKLITQKNEVTEQTAIIESKKDNILAKIRKFILNLIGKKKY